MNISTTTSVTPSPSPAAIGDLLGRVGLAAIFVLAGINKIQFFEGNAQYLASSGLPAALLPVVIAFELVAAAAIVLGYYTRISALALAGFSMVTAALFHNNLSDQIQFLMFFKNLAIAGGFLVLASHGAGRYSLDARLRNSP